MMNTEKIMNRATNLAIEWIEQGHMLDVVVRAGITALAGQAAG